LGGFKATDGFAVIILSTLAAGVGLTITEANHVIHYERWWNASKEDQASDRAYRIGATRDVYIHHIIGALPRVDGVLTLSFDQALNQLITQKRTTAGYLVPPKNINTADIIDATMQATLREKIAAMDWQEFEVLVKKIYEAQGFECELTPAYPAREYGADIVGKKMNETIAVQCKHSQKKNTQDETVIYQLQEEAREHYRANRLIGVTNTQFSLSAKNLAEKYNIALVEQKTLEQLMTELKVFI
jgi:HJR/Mrr/RecB family endonuclease